MGGKFVLPEKKDHMMDLIEHLPGQWGRGLGELPPYKMKIAVSMVKSAITHERKMKPPTYNERSILNGIAYIKQQE